MIFANSLDVLGRHHVVFLGAVFEPDIGISAFDSAAVTKEWDMLEFAASPEAVLEMVVHTNHIAVNMGYLAIAADQLGNAFIVNQERACIPIGNEVRTAPVRLEPELA
jgi:hypothetical protein